jgi:hypothetical protein
VAGTAPAWRARAACMLDQLQIVNPSELARQEYMLLVFERS